MMASNSKRSLIEFAAILRRNGCQHSEKYLCRVCGEELAEQIDNLGKQMIRLRAIEDEIAKLRKSIPVFLFTQD